MKVLIRKRAKSGLLFRLELLSNMLHLAIDKDDKELFKLFYPGYCAVTSEFKAVYRIQYMDCDIDFYADGLDIKRESIKKED